jgi:hypothetical protein
MTSNLFASPLFPPDLRRQIADRYSAFAGWRMEAEGDDGAGDGADGGDKPQGFTQADVDRIVADRLKREREATKTKYADYDDLKKKAEGAKTAEEKIGDLQKEIESTKREAMRRRVQAAHGISDEDADLFLTGADEESLKAQAERLADRESERKKRGNRVPNEGKNSKAGDDPMRTFARGLFGATD